ncbi:hypothetical protein EIP91_002240 [Steccherinum ochraceum]|uniref:Uncharacterized protein n=1 Tax=Steccherinum ochraceum TaxID=92696 RepID=A0A4R0REZ6_9APHY|nr:hypothetical protein EIP91_002240 [Steccherinum ochraceum]
MNSPTSKNGNVGEVASDIGDAVEDPIYDIDNRDLKERFPIPSSPAGLPSSSIGELGVNAKNRRRTLPRHHSSPYAVFFSIEPSLHSSLDLDPRLIHDMASQTRYLRSNSCEADVRPMLSQTWVIWTELIDIFSKV